MGSRPFLWSKQAGRWQSRSYEEVAAEVRRLARGLQALGVTPGDRVALVAENRPEWAIADLAIMAAGGISVPAFTTNTPSDHRHVLTHSGAKGVILSTKAMADRVLPAALEAHELGFIVTIDELAMAQRIGKRVITWQEAQAATPAEGDGEHRCHHRPPHPRRCRLLHLHLGHRRHAQGGDADPRLHPVQLPGGLSPAEGAGRRRRGLPVLPAPLPFL